MSRRPIAFISSTVKDLTDVREHLKERLTDAGFDVRMSEDDSFPVRPGATSHDACLHVVRTADLFVLLVGRRYGGEYPGHNKSITWREWDEAIEAGLHPFVLVEDCVNAWTQECARRRAKLHKEDGPQRLSASDARLSKVFADECAKRRWGTGRDARKRVGSAFGRDLPYLQRFVDALRKGHADNWAHMAWDGSKEHAWEIIASRLGATFAAYRDAWVSLRDEQQTHVERLSALRDFSACVALSSRTGTLDRDQATTLLKVLHNARVALFGCDPEDGFSLTLHRRMGSDEFVPFAWARTSRQREATRRWKVGIGHVGLTAAAERPLIAPDLEQSDGWIASSTEDLNLDRRDHRSAVAVPLCVPVSWVFTVTTSRNNHFASDRAPAVLTVYTVASMIESLLPTGADDEPAAPEGPDRRARHSRRHARRDGGFPKG